MDVERCNIDGEGCGAPTLCVWNDDPKPPKKYCFACGKRDGDVSEDEVMDAKETFHNVRVN